MLTVAEETLAAIAERRGLEIASHLHGQEINPETYAVCKADMLLKGEGENADPEDTVNEALTKRMAARKMLTNASYFAFTAHTQEQDAGRCSASRCRPILMARSSTSPSMATR